jgi:hypothetical protein
MKAFHVKKDQYYFQFESDADEIQKIMRSRSLM